MDEHSPQGTEPKAVKYSLRRPVATLGQPTHPATCRQTWYEYNCVSLSDDKQETEVVLSESQSLLTADDHDAHDEKNRCNGQSGDAQRLIICTKQTQNT